MTYIPAFDGRYAAVGAFEVRDDHIHLSEFCDYFLIYPCVPSK